MYEQLHSLELSPAERAAYETLITQGTMAPPQLAKAAGLTRVNGYAALRGLAQKGLAKEKEINKKQIYSPEPPTRLKELARQKAEAARASLEAVEAIIPSLMNQFAFISGQPGVSFYEGFDGIKQVYDATLKQPYPDEVLVLRSIYDSRLVDDYIITYVRKRAKLGIKSRLVGPYNTPPKGMNLLLYQRRYYDINKFKLPTEIAIFGDKVSLISLRKDMNATVIQSRDVAQTFRIIFELLWAGAAEY